jgi:hypothetical protein
VSLVNRHESNDVKGTNKQIIRHLRTLVHDERSFEYYIHSFDNSETGVTALHARFGSDARKHLNLEPKLPLTGFTNEYVRKFDKNFKHQQDIMAQRSVNNNP